MKKIIAILLVLIMTCALSIVAGCTTGGGDEVITIWHDKEDSVISVLEELLLPLEKEFSIEFVRKDGLTEALKLVGNDVNSAPDMYLFAHDKVGLFSELGILEPMTSFFEEEQLKSQYVGATINAGTYKDNIYQLPLYFETLLFMYNKALMSDSDIPSTTDDLLAYAKQHTNKAERMYGFVEQHSTPYYAIPWIHGFGGSVLSNTGEPTIDTEQVIESFGYHKQFLQYMPSGAEYSTVNTLFTEGMAHSIIAGPWLVPTIRDNNIDLGFAAMPMVNDTNKSLSPFLGVQGLHVLKCAVQDQSNKDKISKVLNALAIADVGAKLAQVSGCAPARLDSYELDYIKADVMVQAMRDTALLATPIPNLPEMDIMFTILGFLMSDINLRGEDIEDSVTARQAKAEELIERMK